MTAIRATGDPNWTPLSATAPDPPIGRSAPPPRTARTQLRQRLRLQRRLAGATRRAPHLHELPETAEEASESWIFNGNHAHRSGRGREPRHEVAAVVLSRSPGRVGVRVRSDARARCAKTAGAGPPGGPYRR